MKIINHTKTNFKTSKGLFKVNQILEFDEKEAAILLRYNGMEELKIEQEEVKKPKLKKSKKKKTD
jgi:hypothetical protein